MANSDAVLTSLTYILDTIIRTKETVDARRRKQNINAALSNLGSNINILCGSTREGFRFRKSDIDSMFIFSDTVVVEQYRDLISDELIFRMVYDRQHRGSVLLELVNCQDVFTDLYVNYRGRDVLSSTLYKEHLKSIKDLASSTINGPCLTSEIDQGYFLDLCSSFKCPTWPSIANEFVHRKRKYGWPSPIVISDIVKHGCYCVPIGDSISEHSSLQWRISFAPAEVRLVHAFSHCEFKVFALLKILNSDILKEIVDYTDGQSLLTSYHLKTIMFLMKENSPPSFWRERNMFNCFWMCFNFLIKSVENGFLCHYFIPSNNVFRRRIYGRNRYTLLNCLYTLRYKGVGVLYECSSLLPYLVRAQTGYNLCMTPAQKELQYDKETFVPSYPFRFEVSDTKIVTGILSVLNHPCDICVHTSLTSLAHILNEKSSTLLKSTREANLDNRSTYIRRRMCKHYLMFGCNTDVSKGWLYLATYHYLIGQHRLAFTMCQHVMNSIKPWSIIPHNVIQEEAYEQKFCRQGIDILLKMKRAFSNPCKFHINSMYLNEISPEIEQPLHPVVLIYPQPYAAFLSFLCCHHMTDVTGQHTALSNLLALQYDKIQGAISGDPRTNIIYTLIGICYEMVGDNHNAVINYLTSARQNHDCASAAQMRADRICQYMRRGN